MLKKIFFLLPIFLAAILHASVAPDQPPRFADLTISAYYSLFNERYGKAIPYHLYEGIVRHIIDYKNKKETLTTRRELEDITLCLHAHIHQIVVQHDCTQHMQALLQECGVEETFIHSLPSSPRSRRRR